ncbi:MAG: diaminopropionate ammonia-lyase [Pseudomonadota bacterium]
MLSAFENAHVAHYAATPSFSDKAVNTLSRDGFDAAEREITSWEGYQATDLIRLHKLEEILGAGEIFYKDEGPRFGLGSFKALGGAYAVQRVLKSALEAELGQTVPMHDVRSGVYADQLASKTIISATDGNHGRSVAWGATRCGAKCRIYIHAEVSEHRAEVMRGLGADVIRVDGDYDESVAQTRRDADAHGWLIVSDTSWPGYKQPPMDVMAGYGVMAREIVRDMDPPATHVFLQGGVGGLAAGVAAVFAQEWHETPPHVVIVEPDLAPCLFASAQAQQAKAIQIETETIMAGLSCGEASQIAWDVLEGVSSSFVTIPDTVVPPAVRLLAQSALSDTSVASGESAVAGLCALISGALQPDLKERLGLNDTSRVVLIGSEGVTDPHVYQQIMDGEL